jgi:glycosyltransferase involved in cell wall biosynthesis
MKILLIGPFPPPHGGISVHLLGAYRQLTEVGISCRVLQTERRPEQSSAYARARQWAAFVWELLRHARQGWTLHLHTNGHNWKSWTLVTLCGLAGRQKGRCLLTLHSGMAPAFLRNLPVSRRVLSRSACSLYARVICVSPEIRQAVLELGVVPDRVDLLPAYLGAQKPGVALDQKLVEWLSDHRPVLSTTLFFRPEYGFELLLAGLAHLRLRRPDLGWLVMGSGEQQAQAEKQIRESNLQDSVVLLGDVDHDTCLAVIASSDLFVRPTLQDADSVSVREALAMEVPVVASDTGTRPAGVTLFEKGNVDDMVSKLELGLAAPTAMYRSAGDSVGHLLDIYRRVAIPEKSYVAA